jgi:YHS domain-containing protein
MSWKTTRRIPVRVMDPQCGKSVDPEGAIRLTWEGKSYFFCSETCRAQFEADPPGDASF